MTAIEYAILILGQVPSLIASGQSVVALVSDGKATLEKMQAEKRDPTDAEWSELNEQIKTLRGELHS